MSQKERTVGKALIKDMALGLLKAMSLINVFQIKMKTITQ